MSPLTPAEEWAGQQRQGMAAPLRSLYLTRLTSRVQGALEGLRRSTRPEDLRRLPEWEALAQGLEEMKKEWEAWQR